MSFEGEPKAAACLVGFRIVWRSKAQRLNYGERGQAARQRPQSITTLDPSAIGLRVKTGREGIAKRRHARRRHPVVGKSEGAGEISRTPVRRSYRGLHGGRRRGRRRAPATVPS